MIGMPGLIEYKTIEENIQVAKELDLDFIELNMNLPIYSHLMDTGHVKNLLEENNLQVSLHLSENFDPCDLNPVIRAAHLENFRRAAIMAKDLDAILLNMHMSKGIHFTLPDKKVLLYEVFKEDYLGHIYEFRDLIEEMGVRVSIENTGIHHLSFIGQACDYLLSSDLVSLTYDIGHDVKSGYKDKAYYDEHVDHIKHFHIHDGDSEHDHKTLYSCGLDIDAFIELAEGKHASYVIEVKSSDQLRESIRRMRK